MKNLSLREQVLLISLIFFAVSALLISFVLYPLIKKGKDLRVELDNVRKEEIECKNLEETLRANKEALANLDNDIKGHEAKFLSTLNTECIEQALMAKFEENGSPYLDSISVVDESNIGGSIDMPNGTQSEATLLCKKYTVKYSTTDGICAPHYNHTDDYAIDGTVKKDVISSAVQEMNSGNLKPHDGFDEFFETLKQLEDEYDCKILVTKFDCTSDNGYEMLSADIAFFSVNSKFRISAIDDNEEFVKWGGSDDITLGGLIYYSLIETSEESSYYNIYMKDVEVSKRPFAALFAKALFAANIDDFKKTGEFKPFSLSLS